MFGDAQKSTQTPPVSLATQLSKICAFLHIFEHGGYLCHRAIRFSVLYALSTQTEFWRFSSPVSSACFSAHACPMALTLSRERGSQNSERSCQPNVWLGAGRERIGCAHPLVSSRPNENIGDDPAFKDCKIAEPLPRSQRQLRPQIPTTRESFRASTDAQLQGLRAISAAGASARGLA